MKKITFEIEDYIYKLIEKRAEKNLMKVEDMIKDIVRRSMVSYNDKGEKSVDSRVDDPLVNVFSRTKRGRR